MTMTRDEFLSAIEKRGAQFAPAAGAREITLAGNALQAMRAAMLAPFIIELYSATGGINLGSGYIFGPTEWTENRRFPTPSIVDVNKEISNMPNMRGFTVFGRNDLFWFAFDAFGVCYMLDNLTLRRLRKYDDPYRAMTDCLIAGKI